MLLGISCHDSFWLVRGFWKLKLRLSMIHEWIVYISDVTMLHTSAFSLTPRTMVLWEESHFIPSKAHVSRRRTLHHSDPVDSVYAPMAQAKNLPVSLTFQMELLVSRQRVLWESRLKTTLTWEMPTLFFIGYKPFVLRNWMKKGSLCDERVYELLDNR